VHQNYLRDMQQRTSL